MTTIIAALVGIFVAIMFLYFELLCMERHLKDFNETLKDIADSLREYEEN